MYLKNLIRKSLINNFFNCLKCIYIMKACCGQFKTVYSTVLTA
jgi:hypothetical protein